MYSHLRLATCASLIFFGAVVAAGAMAVVPWLVERLSPGTQVSHAPICANGEAVSKDGECTSWHAPRVGTDVQPIDPGQVRASAKIDNTPQRSAAKRAAAAPDRTVGTPDVAAPVPFSQVAVPLRSPEIAAPLHSSQVTAAPSENPPQTAHAEKDTRTRPAQEAKPRLSAVKKPRRERTAERRSHKALAAMRRFEEPRRDIPLSAYAAEPVPRRIVIRPTSIQDVDSARP